MKSWFKKHSKAIGGAVSGGGAALAAALVDGHITGGEWVTIAGAVLGAFGIVYQFPKNKTE